MNTRRVALPPTPAAAGDVVVTYGRTRTVLRVASALEVAVRFQAVPPGAAVRFARDGLSFRTAAERGATVRSLLDGPPPLRVDLATCEHLPHLLLRQLSGSSGPRALC